MAAADPLLCATSGLFALAGVVGYLRGAGDPALLALSLATSAASAAHWADPRPAGPRLAADRATATLSFVWVAVAGLARPGAAVLAVAPALLACVGFLRESRWLYARGDPGWRARHAMFHAAAAFGHAFVGLVPPG